jgi:SAM-dependent methyltransferase
LTEVATGGMADGVAAAQVRIHVCPACGGGLEAGPRALACSACRAAYPHENGIARFAAGRASAPAYDVRDFARLSRVEDEQFWFVSRRAIILDGLRRCVPDLAARPLYDVGCGPGGLLAYLAAQGVPVAGACDAYVEGLVLARRRLGGVPLAHVDNDGPPPLARGQKMLGMFDVLEHLDDDEGMLRWAAGVLEPGGILVVTVPAHPFLFDEADALAFHRRRYRRRELDERLRRAGFDVRLLTHFMSPLVPMLILSRALGRLVRGRSLAAHRQSELGVVPVLNPALRAVLALERAVLRVARPPFGTSLLAVAARSDGATAA